MAQANALVQIKAAAAAAGIDASDQAFAFAIGFMSGMDSAAPAADELVMTYFPIAGRGECARLIAAAGGLTLKDNFEKPAALHPDYASPSGLPLLDHGSFKLAQSNAIESYLISIAPKFAQLDPKQRATDLKFCCIKEELLLNTATIIFKKKEEAATLVPPLFDKWFAVIEARLPTEAFVNGLAFPTGAECAVYNICTGYMPFGAAWKAAGYSLDKAKFPKIATLVQKLPQMPGVKEYVAATKTQDGNPWGM